MQVFRAMTLRELCDFDFKIRLAMAAFFKIVALGFVFDDRHFFGAGDFGNLSLYLGALDKRLAERCGVAVVGKEHFVKNDLIAHVVGAVARFAMGTFDFFYLESSAFLNEILLAAGLDYREIFRHIDIPGA